METGIRKGIYILPKHDRAVQEIGEYLDSQGIRGVLGSGGEAKISVVVQVLLEQKAKELGVDIDQRSLWKKKASKE